ncbi:MAG TPA: SDR family oxidoreductase [Myxococcota bacterium]|jgi:short-subunit dehydrogenase|nr:SDR family oxidoreductase [Myxococcota bacterium]
MTTSDPTGSSDTRPREGRASFDSGPSGPRRRALVTGASVGIGEAFAERLARDQYDLVLVARSRDRLEAIAKRLGESRGVSVEVLVADLARPHDLALVEQRLREEPTFDLLVNNAGLGTYGSFAELDVEREEDEVRLNVIAPLRLTRAVLPGMLERRQGAVINVSSLAGLAPTPYNATYGATKAFVNSFTEALHEELRDTGVRLQLLQPGFTRTEFQERAGMNTAGVPDFAWMEPIAVVDASLEALRRGDLVCVPGGANRAVAAFTSLLPRSLARRISGAAAKRFGG